MRADEPVDIARSPAGRPLSTLDNLAMVLLPYSLERRARAAASLPFWVTVLMVAVAVPVAIEAGGYIVAVAAEIENSQYRQQEGIAQSSALAQAVGEVAAAAQGELKLHVLPELRHMTLFESTFASMGILGAVLLGLGIISGLIVLPFGVPFGARILSVHGQVRRMVVALTSAWLVAASVTWVAVCLPLAVGVMWLSALRNESSHWGIVVLAVLGVLYTPMVLVLGWLLRLVRTASSLATGPKAPLTPRCGDCGYLLEGLAEGAACPECGCADPGSVDRQRGPTAWTQRRQIGWRQGLLQPIVLVLLRPGKLFSQMEVLTGRTEAVTFLSRTLWLSMASSVVLLPGIVMGTVGQGGNTIEPGEVLVCLLASVAIGPPVALAGLVLVGLAVLLIGYLVGRARQEPAWPIAGTAGCYLAGLVPWTIGAEGLWLVALTGLLASGRKQVIEKYCRMIAGVDWELVIVLLFFLPAIVAVGILIHRAVVCYRRVRYACR